MKLVIVMARERIRGRLGASLRWKENQFAANSKSKPKYTFLGEKKTNLKPQLLSDIDFVYFSVVPFEEKNPLPLPSNKASGLRGCH